MIQLKEYETMNYWPSEIFFEIGSFSLGRDRWSLLKTCQNAYKARLYTYPENSLYTLKLTKEQMDLIFRLKASNDLIKILSASSGFGKTLIALAYLISFDFIHHIVIIAIHEEMFDYWINEIRKTYPQYLRLVHCIRKSNNYIKSLKEVKSGILLIDYSLYHHRLYRIEKILSSNISLIVYDVEIYGILPQEIIPTLYLTCSNEWCTPTVEAKPLEMARIPSFDENRYRIPHGDYLLYEIQMLFFQRISLWIQEKKNKPKKVLILLPPSLEEMVEDIVRIFSFPIIDIALHSVYGSIVKFNEYKGEEFYLLVLRQTILLSGYGIFPEACIIPNHPFSQSRLFERILQERNPYKVIDIITLGIPSHLA